MKKFKSIISIIICMVMMLTLAVGCNGGVASAPTSQPTQTAGVAVAEGLPIVEETTEISYWFEMSPQIVTYIDDMNDNITWQLIEELTNVHVDFQSVTANTAEDFNIRITSGDWPDIMLRGKDYYTGGASKAIEDEVFLELTDVVNEYMPNYASIVYSDNDILKQVTMEDGGIGAIFAINHNYEEPLTGPIIRKDWLDELGIDSTSIETYDDYHDVLTQFKTVFGAESALHLSAYGVPMGNYLVAGYGIAGYSWPEQNNAPFYQVDGEIRYGYIQPEFKEYLTMLNQWYDEGLISSDFVSNTNPYMITPEDVGTGKSGIWYHMSQIMEEHVSQAADEGFDTVAIKDAVKKSGDTTNFANYEPTVVSVMSLSISATCENVDVVAKWVDFFFSDFGSLVISFGVQGETWDYDENGEPQFTDLILKNEDGMGLIVASNVYAIQTGIGLLYEKRYYSGYTQAAREAGTIWLETVDLDNFYAIPSVVTLNGDDSTTYALTYADISTYAIESVAKFITGARSLNEFDAFVAEIERMNIQECIACWQRAYSSYIG